MKACYPNIVERWSVFEVTVPGKTEGNPFLDHDIFGVFAHKNERVSVSGFYDGEGIYKVRFMPSFEGSYRFTVSGSFSDTVLQGSFEVKPASGGNHGPVKVAGTYHFAYADGTPYYPVGTTCYAWAHQPQALRTQTLETLKNGCFNKLRMCILPKHYIYNFRDPEFFPYEGSPCDSSGITEENWETYRPDSADNHWDLTRFNPEFFRNLEKQIQSLMDLGIEADLIVMHAYDRWGFSIMDRDADDRYWSYVIARFAAYRNVWWSLANEYDLMKTKSHSDWEHYADLLCSRDPYDRLRSVHNCMAFYDYSAPWITHCCIQRQDAYKCAELTDAYRIRYQKPVVLDEIAYEGNLTYGWGNISGEELVRRFWEATARGGYASHGETYHGEELWWSHGGVLHGESHPRLKFLRTILEKTPGLGLKPIAREWDEVVATAENGTFYYLIYLGFTRPIYRDYDFGTEPYMVEVIDTWEMKRETLGPFTGRVRIPLPGKKYMALRIYRPESED